MIKYSYQQEGTIVLIDKSNKKSYVTYVTDFKGGGIVNDFDGGINFQPVSYFSENGTEYMIGLINPYQIKTRIADIGFLKSEPTYPERKKGLEELANSLKETDNPVLIMVRLK